MVPIALPLIWRKFLQLKMKLFRASRSAKTVVMTLVATVLIVLLSRAFLVAAMLYEFVMLV